MEVTRRDRVAIKAFLQTALADGAVPAKDLEIKARAAGLLAEGLPLSQCHPLRRIADKLHILRYREDDRWWWRLPMTRMTSRQDDDKVTAPAPDLVLVPGPTPPPAIQDDPAAARRKFAEQSLKRLVELTQEVAPRARAAVDKYLQTGDLRDLFPTEH
jgi:hypothetical protein